MYSTSIILTSNVQFKYRAILSHLKRYVKKVKFENDDAFKNSIHFRERLRKTSIKDEYEKYFNQDFLFNYRAASLNTLK